MDIALDVLGSTVIVLVWLAPAFLLTICATCEGCSRLLNRLHPGPHPDALSPGAPSR